MTALQTLLSRLVDYAGLFPPASLPLPAVVGNYARYLEGGNRWMLGRLIVPARQLGEFEETFQRLFPNAGGAAPWQISALIPGIDDRAAYDRALQTIDEFNNRFPSARVDTVEGKLSRADQIDPLLASLPESLTAFLEMPHNAYDTLIPRLASAGRPTALAKIRTGGVTPDLIPDPDVVAGFVAACGETGLGFKATAGLHHPVRGVFPLTYDPQAEQALMHGFLNVFVAACLVRAGLRDRAGLAEVLACRDPAAFRFQAESLEFAGRRIHREEIAEIRRTFAVSFGSCSFTEPLEEIRRPGWLESNTSSAAPG